MGDADLFKQTVFLSIPHLNRKSASSSMKRIFHIDRPECGYDRKIFAVMTNQVATYSCLSNICVNDQALFRKCLYWTHIDQQMT